MRVLFVSREYPPYPAGGVGSYVASMASSLAARGHDVHVLSCWGDQEIADYSDRGVHVHRRKEIRVKGLWRVRRHARKTVTAFLAGLSTFSAYRDLRTCFDVIEYPDIVAEGWMFALRRPAPLVAHIHSPLDLYCRVNDIPRTLDIRMTSRLERFAVRRADVVTSPSCLMVNTLKEMKWLPRIRSQVIPHPIRCEDSAEGIAVQDTMPTILFMNRLERNKAPELLVQAMAAIRKAIPEAKAIFIGSNGKRNDGMPYLEWMRTIGHDFGGCEFVGEVPRERIPEFLSKSRVVAIPSWFESYSMATIEAMAAGRPVVVTRTMGVSELVEQTGAGSVISSGDSEALADALLPFLLDARYADRIGQAGRKAVREHLAPDLIAAQREMAFRTAIGISGGRAPAATVYMPGHQPR